MIDVHNLTKNYGALRAVDGISFSIKKGEVTGLLGPNGAGKTTTMRILTGYLNATSGDVRIKDMDIACDMTAVKRMIGYLPESAPLYGDMIVYDYLEYAAKMHGIISTKRIRETASMCGLVPVMHKNISELSKGYRQRVGLAHAMIHDPEILILDEPTSGLDPNQIIEIRKLIREIGKEKTVILSTHILPEVEATCDRVIIISRGHIVADDKTGSIQSKSASGVSVYLTLGSCTSEEAADVLKGVSGVQTITVMEPSDGLVSLVCQSGADSDVRPDLFRCVADRGWLLYEMRKEQNTLEKVFRELTVGGENE
ncbi:MAG: ATP-binding cassette domain-containing protein [Spirochaetota bacterium]